MAKRNTSKAALRNELELLAIGVLGSRNVEDDPENGCFAFSTMGCEKWCQWLDAIAERWNLYSEESNHKWVIQPWNLHEFEGLDSATEHLHTYGARAGGTWG